MAGVRQPFMYSAVQRSDSRFPDTQFDPKAITRASWEPQKPKPKSDGPLVSFNRYPDAQTALSYRFNNYSSMSPRTKSFIKWLRYGQLVIRVLELISALGLMVLMILITNVEAVTGWIMRITPGVVALHCIYAVFHLSRDAAGRPPASSAAYHLFSAITDGAAAPIYAFSAMMVHNKSGSWKTRLDSQSLMEIFVPVVYYTFIAAGGLHLASLSTSLWLGWMFRKISLMPPDMNPLEDHLTARPKHKKAKSSTASFSTIATDNMVSTSHDTRRQSAVTFNAIEPPSSVSFMHTRTGSATTLGTRASRQHDSILGSSRDSIASRATKRTSAARSFHGGSYTEIPLSDPAMSRPTSDGNRNNQSRPAKFTETWAPTDSLISRTNQRHREMEAAKTSAQNRSSKSYEALTQHYYNDDSSGDEYGDENIQIHHDDEADLAGDLCPHPLRLNPTASEHSIPPRAKGPFYAIGGNSLSEVSSNARRPSASQDIADEKPGLAPAKPSPRNRQSSIQPETDFYARPYGELKSGIPPIVVGSNRKVSSGNDYDSQHASVAFERRNVSGKIAEEGRGGTGNRALAYESRFRCDEW